MLPGYKASSAEMYNTAKSGSNELYQVNALTYRYYHERSNHRNGW